MHAGDVFADRFELDRIAGSGGMGEVWRARDRVTGADVALKLLQLEGNAARDRFAREAALLSGLTHPAIVRYVAHGSDGGGMPFLAMEWLDGEDLEQHLGRRPLDVSATLAIARRLADALATAHAAGIVHRDVKPSNVILIGGKADQAKLVDFGVARPLLADATVRSNTKTGAPVGSPGYMAPEQARGERDVGPPADVFALGCVLYECVTGRPAFAGEHLMAILAKLVLEEPQRASELAAVPPLLDDLLARMLSKDPLLRPCDGAALAEELASLGPTPSQRPPQLSLPGSLGRDEMRLVSVVIAAGEGLAHNAPTLTPEAAETDAKQNAELIAIAERHGARMIRLADRTRLAVLIGQGMATDQAARAARAALEMQRSLEKTPIAVATGRAVVQGRLPVGEAIDRGVKLVTTQATMGIRLDRLTAGLLDTRFELGGDGSGLRLLGERARTEAVRTVLGKPTPCVGRDRELATLMDLFDECLEEPIARAVVITGAPGIGKSRLRHEWIRRLRTESAAQLWTAQGDPMAAGSPFAMLGQMLRQAAGVALGEPPEVSQGKLRARIARHVPDDSQSRLAEFIGEIVRVPFPDDHSVQLRAARADAEVMGDHMIRAWLDFASAELDAGSLVLVLEDLQWGDLPTVQYVDAALRALKNKPLFVLALARSDVDRVFSKLWHERNVQTIALGELRKRASETLVRAVLGDTPDVARIVEQAAGHPLLLEELVRAAAEGRSGETPETVLAIVQARLETLPEPARRVLRAASIFGTSFWKSALVALLGGPNRADETNEWIHYLVEREVIARISDTRFAREEELVFPQALAREAAYASLLEQDRVLGHRLAAEWLEAAGERDAGTLAEHYEKGGAKPKALGWWLRAAEAALEASDLDAAIARARRGIACGAEGATLAALLAVEGEAHEWRGEHAESLACLTQVLDLVAAASAEWFEAVEQLVGACDRLGMKERVGELVGRLLKTEPQPGAECERGRAMARAAPAMIFGGRLELADELLDAVVRIADAHPEDVVLEARLGKLLGVRASQRGQRGQVLVELRRSYLAWQRAGNAKRVADAAVNLTDAWMYLGRYGEAADAAYEGIKAAERLGLVLITAWGRHNLSFALTRAGKLAEARTAASEARDAFEKMGDRRAISCSSAYLADIDRRLGDRTAAERWARAAVEAAEVHAPARAQALGILARVLLDGGNNAGALEASRAGMTIIDEVGGIEEGEAMLRLVHADALRASGDVDGAKRAIETARARVLAESKGIEDPALRSSYLENVEEHARILRYLQMK
jgi:tetratricopeptide (TPR) repeat protein